MAGPTIVRVLLLRRPASGLRAAQIARFFKNLPYLDSTDYMELPTCSARLVGGGCGGEWRDT